QRGSKIEILANKSKKNRDFYYTCVKAIDLIKKGHFSSHIEYLKDKGKISKKDYNKVLKTKEKYLSSIDLNSL
ncbi:MAG: hypothetical protein ACQERZ_05260, partial [Fusobacteriota bacterium]